MMFNEIYGNVMQSYEGDNKITIGMREDFIHEFNTHFGEKLNDDYYKVALSMLITKAMNARTFRGFERITRKMNDFVQYPVEFSNYVSAVNEWKKGYRKSCPI